MVIIDDVRLSPAWRGLGGVGRLLTGRLLRWISDQPRVVAVHPFPIDLDDDACQDPAVFDPAMRRVRGMWVRFEPFTDDIWIMDPQGHLLAGIGAHRTEPGPAIRPGAGHNSTDHPRRHR